MRRSRKSEFRSAVNEGMKHAFFEVTYLDINEAVEAKKHIAIISAGVADKHWAEYRNKCQSLDDAQVWGEVCGRDAWSDEDMEKVAQLAKIETRL